VEWQPVPMAEALAEERAHGAEEELPRNLRQPLLPRPLGPIS